MANCADCDYKRGNVRLKRLENWERNLAKETKNTLRDSVYSALKAMIVT
ncbi:MAG: GntR family transcriptional regulator, partial [Mesorhizobium sp.]